MSTFTQAKMPGIISVGFARIGYELKTYLRTPDSMFFNFSFPLMMLLVFSIAFSGTDFGIPELGIEVTSAQYFLPAMVAMGIFISGAQNLGIDIAIERNDGTLKRLAGSPIAPVSYFIGKFGQVLVTGLAQLVILLIVGGVILGAGLPTSVDRWLTLAWIFFLGIMASAVIGITISALPRSAKSATSVIVPPILILQFISGVYLQFSQLPEWLQNVASIFPLKWIAQGMRYVFLPDAYQGAETGGEWNLGAVALVLVVWFVVGTIGAALTFRWTKRN
jgi:ABC-2 type transport system permease protein